MKCTIHIDPNVNCALINLSDDYEFRDLDEFLNRMINHPDHHPDTNILVDGRDLRMPPDKTYKSLSENFKLASQIFSSKTDTCRSGIVVGDAQNYAKVHQYIVSGRLEKTPVERKVFRDIGKAKAWLGLPEGYEIKNPERGETA